MNQLENNSPNKACFYNALLPGNDPIHIFDSVKNAFGVRSIEELLKNVSKLSESLPQNNKLNALVITDHGCSINQGVGSGKSFEYKRGKDFHINHLHDYVEPLKKIADHLLLNKNVPVPLFMLGGCDTGTKPKEYGQSLPRLLSTHVPNVCFIAPKGRVLPTRPDPVLAPTQVSVVSVYQNMPSDVPPDLAVCLNGESIKFNDISLSQKNCYGVDAIRDAFQSWELG